MESKPENSNSVFKNKDVLFFKRIFQVSLVLIAGVIASCSPSKFSLDKDPCEKDSSCSLNNGKYEFNETQAISGGKVDILFVNDNSASMSFEQRKLAERFQNFIQRLDGRYVDYRISMTTTDISSSSNPPRTINGQGSLQDGRLIAMGGYAFLTPQIANRVSLFSTAVQRPETSKCEQFIAQWILYNGIMSTMNSQYSDYYKQNCPSGDERGIYAANLVALNNHQGFIRSDAHLAIIFIADEDERSQLYGSLDDFSLESLDQPSVLVANIRAKHGSQKKISVHSITVKDSSCLQQQNSQILGNPPVSSTQGFVRGTVGTLYQALPQNGWGKSVDICASDYTSPLGEISAHIVDQIQGVDLKCSVPLELNISLTSGGSLPSYTVSGKRVVFAQPLPAGTKVNVSYKCTELN